MKVDDGILSEKTELEKKKIMLGNLKRIVLRKEIIMNIGERDGNLVYVKEENVPRIFEGIEKQIEALEKEVDA